MMRPCPLLLLALRDNTSARICFVSLAVMTASIGIFALSVGIVGWFLRPLSLPERLVWGATSLLLIKPGSESDILGVGILALLGGFAWLRARRLAA